MTECVEPGAPVVKCCVCGADVHTCERKEPAGPTNDFRCPAHPDGVQLEDGRCVCSLECYEIEVL